MKTITKTSEQAKREREEKRKRDQEDSTCPECGHDVRYCDAVEDGMWKRWKLFYCRCGCEWKTELK